MPQLDVATYISQLFWLLVTFSFLYVLAKTLILPKIGSVLESRRRRIADDMEAAERLQRQAEEALQQHDALLAEARGKAQDLVRAEKEKVLAEIAERRQQIEAELAAKISQAEAALRKSKEKALAELDGTIGDLASEIASKVTGKPLPEKAVRAALNATGKED